MKIHQALLPRGAFCLTMTVDRKGGGKVKRYPTVTFRLPPELLEALKARAKLDGATLGGVIRAALEAFLA